MTFTLRPYQEKLKLEASRAAAEHKHVIAQAPGGTGKTKTFLSIAKSANQKGRSVLIISERTAVYKQIAEESNGIRIGDGIKHVKVEPGKLYVAMAQTLSRRPKIIEQFNSLEKEVVVIVDECHISTAKSILDKLHNRITIGFTATPDYRIAKHLPKYYNELVATNQVKWFIENGYLCDYQHIVRKSGAGVSKIKKTGGDYNEQEQRKFFGTEAHYQELFKDLSEIPFKKCMLFTASIKHADEVYERMTAEGYKCSIFHSKRSDNEWQIARFEGLNETNIIISVGALSTGYDNPEVDCIVLYRATTSLALYLQMVFRADRPKEGMFFWVLDYGMNGKTHGTYDQDRDWHSLWRKPEKKKKEGVAGIKLCPKCDSMLFVAATICKFCNHEFPKVINNDIGKAEELTNKKLMLQGKKISDLTPKELALYANIYDKKRFASRVARAREQSEKGYLSEYARSMGYQSGWVFQQKQLITPKKIEYADLIL